MERLTKKHPMLFNTEMVRAILEDRKTVTRRAVKPQPSMPYCHEDGGEWFWTSKDADDDMMDWWPSYEIGLCPPCRTGDILYVRETWGDYSECQPGGAGYYLYRADYPDNAKTYDFDGHICDLPRWHPSIHMPREAARIFLRVTNVRMERLQNINDARACEEGAEGDPCDCDGSVIFCSRCCNTGWIVSPRSQFQIIWDRTIKKADLPHYGWTANPWVWVIEFKRISKEDAEHG